MFHCEVAADEADHDTHLIEDQKVTEMLMEILDSMSPKQQKPSDVETMFAATNNAAVQQIENLQFDLSSQADSSSPSLEKLQLIESGTFGEVWKAMYKPKGKLCAVRIVPTELKQSWTTELETFKALQPGHKNIVQYYGAKEHNDGSQLEYWLITAHHERGSLCEYLKSNTVTYNQACSISYTMARGLAYLHGDTYAGSSKCTKPPIAHRNFKSTSVHLRDDFTACIADFDLAIVFNNGGFDDSHPMQVGMPRYLAPEVLKGTMGFSSTSFQRVDMYAFGLVLWEILSRCTTRNVKNGITTYKLPFEAELGEHPKVENPTVKQMYELVVLKKIRPVIEKSWTAHQHLSNICEMVDDCWNDNLYARVSAAYAAKKFRSYF